MLQTGITWLASNFLSSWFPKSGTTFLLHIHLLLVSVFFFFLFVSCFGGTFWLSLPTLFSLRPYISTQVSVVFVLECDGKLCSWWLGVVVFTGQHEMAQTFNGPKRKQPCANHFKFMALQNWEGPALLQQQSVTQKMVTSVDIVVFLLYMLHCSGRLLSSEVLVFSFPFFTIWSIRSSIKNS